MKRLHIVTLTSACLFLLCAASRAEEAKTSAPKTAAAQPQSKKWEYHKEDWFKYVDGLTGAMPIMDLPEGPKVNRENPAFAELKTNLGFSDVAVSSMAAIVELYAEVQELGKERTQIETRMAGFEENDKWTKEYKAKMGAKADELYSHWKRDLDTHDKKIEAKLRALKKSVESFNSRFSSEQRARFLDWKRKKIKGNEVKEQEAFEKEKARHQKGNNSK